MTSITPYKTKKSEYALMNAVRGEQLPADLEEIAVITATKFIPSILEGCWRQNPETRPGIESCLQVLGACGPSLLGGVVPYAPRASAKDIETMWQTMVFNCVSELQ